MTTDTQHGNGSPDYWAGVRQGRMMTRIDACCCTFDEHGNGPLNVCGAHDEWVKEKVAAEREACAKIAYDEDHGGMIVCQTIARKIRARGA